MEKELTEFKIEVLTQLAVINSKLDGYNELKKEVTETDDRSKKNEQNIKKNAEEIAKIQDTNKWAFRTSIGAIIVSAVGIIFAFIEKGIG